MPFSEDKDLKAGKWVQYIMLDCKYFCIFNTREKSSISSNELYKMLFPFLLQSAKCVACAESFKI